MRCPRPEARSRWTEKPQVERRVANVPRKARQRRKALDRWLRRTALHSLAFAGGEKKEDGPPRGLDKEYGWRSVGCLNLREMARARNIIRSFPRKRESSTGSPLSRGRAENWQRRVPQSGVMAGLVPAIHVFWSCKAAATRRQGSTARSIMRPRKFRGGFMSQAAEKRGGTPAMLKDAAFVWDDPLDREGGLTEDERMVRNTARGFAQSYLMPRVIEAFRDETYDPGMLPEMGKLGLLGPTIPEEYGGAGLGYVSYGLITRRLERGD